MTDLPESWEQVEIVEVLSKTENGKPFQQGWSPQCESYPAAPDGWGVLKTTAIQHGEFRDRENKALPTDLDPRPLIEVKAGDVLMTCAGPRNRCGVACLVEYTRPRLMMSGKMYRFRPHPEALHPKYLAYLIQRRETQLQIDLMKTGISDSGLNLTHDRFGQLPVPLAPLPEQHRIVAKIEALFSELDKAVESLTLARAQLKTYRQALLKHAFEGKLTADWRAANPDKLEPPEALLSRIRKEREEWYRSEQEAWEARCAEWDAAGRIGPRPSRPEPHSAAAPLRNEELEPLPGIPQGWAYTRLSEVACLGSGVSVSKERQYDDPVEVAYLRVANVQRGHLDLSVIKTMPVERTQLASLALRAFDVLFNEGGDRDKLGRGWVWEDAVSPCVTQNHVFRATMFAASPAKAKLLSHWGNSEGQDYFEKGGKQTTNLASINKTVLKALPVPIMHPSEADELFARLDSALSQVDAVESEIDTALAKANALRQSILKQAFSGQLVQQDPADEPASALLARLRSQSRSIPTARKRRA